MTIEVPHTTEGMSLRHPSWLEHFQEWMGERLKQAVEGEGSHVTLASCSIEPVNFDPKAEPIRSTGSDMHWRRAPRMPGQRDGFQVWLRDRGLRDDLALDALVQANAAVDVMAHVFGLERERIGRAVVGMLADKIDRSCRQPGRNLTVQFLRRKLADNNISTDKISDERVARIDQAIVELASAMNVPRSTAEDAVFRALWEKP